MKKANMSNKLWSEDEDIYLKKYFSTTKNEFLAEKLNRTKDSIVVRANKLGLKKNKPPKWHERVKFTPGGNKWLNILGIKN